jgi:hypothetical protein
VVRSRLHAQHEELPAPTAEARTAAASVDAAEAEVEPQAGAHQQPAAHRRAAAAAAEEQRRAGSPGQAAEGAGSTTPPVAQDSQAAEAFSAAPMEGAAPVVLPGAAHSGRSGHAAAAGSQLDDSAAFAPRPKLAASPAVSGASARQHSMASLLISPAEAAATAETSADTADSQPSAHRLSVGLSAPAVTPASVEPVGAPRTEQPAPEPQPGGPEHAEQEQAQAGQDRQPAAAPHAGQQAAPGRGAWSDNPLAAAGATPAAGGGRRLSHSPAPRWDGCCCAAAKLVHRLLVLFWIETSGPTSAAGFPESASPPRPPPNPHTHKHQPHFTSRSGLSAGGVSNNPMYAGTPSHPTPPSVSFKSFAGRASLAGEAAGLTASAGFPECILGAAMP